MLPAYALRSAVGTLSLSTSATEQQPGLFSCAFVGIGVFLSKCRGSGLGLPREVLNRLKAVTATAGGSMSGVDWAEEAAAQEKELLNEKVTPAS